MVRQTQQFVQQGVLWSLPQATCRARVIYGQTDPTVCPAGGTVEPPMGHLQGQGDFPAALNRELEGNCLHPQASPSCYLPLGKETQPL